MQTDVQQWIPVWFVFWFDLWYNIDDEFDCSCGLIKS